MSSRNKSGRVKLIQRLSTRTTLRQRAIPALSFLFVCALILFQNTTSHKTALASSGETFSSGSYIINMGVTPQTIANGLKPYGMVYDLVANYNVPVKWVIEDTKAKDGADFTYNGTSYKGGTFIIPVDYITSTVTTRISYWNTQGVQGAYTTTSVTVPVYATLTTMPKTLIDNLSNNQSIITGYFTNAGIPSSAYTTGSPSALSTCHDLWVNPHGDPTWTTHGYLYNFVTTQKSFIWSECHAVSVLEGTFNPGNTSQQLNYLTTSGMKCYSSGKCGTSVTETHGGNATTPYTHNYPSDPIMQFMGTMDGASNGGSEKWYQPLSTGGWRTTTKRLVTTSDGSSPNEGVLMAYGPAYGNTNYGWVMYEAGHDIDGNGTTAEKVAAQRAFFNFYFFAGKNKGIQITSYSIPSSFTTGETQTVSVSVSSGTSPYTYTWTSNVGGTFENPTAAGGNFVPPSVTSVTSGIITCVVTDACGRRNFVSSPVIFRPSSLPITLTSFKAAASGEKIKLTWTTGNEINNDFFTIERSKDGRNFSPVIRKSGAGNSTSTIQYSSFDERPMEGMNYYRLKQTDYDGKSTYSEIESARFDTKLSKDALAVESVRPNPFTTEFSLNYSLSAASTVDIQLINSSGKQFLHENLPANEGLNTFNYTKGDALLAGTYFLVITSGEERKTIRLVRQ